MSTQLPTLACYTHVCNHAWHCPCKSVEPRGVGCVGGSETWAASLTDRNSLTQALRPDTSSVPPIGGRRAKSQSSGDERVPFALTEAAAWGPPSSLGKRRSRQSWSEVNWDQLLIATRSLRPWNYSFVTTGNCCRRWGLHFSGLWGAGRCPDNPPPCVCPPLATSQWVVHWRCSHPSDSNCTAVPLLPCVSLWCGK